MSLFGNDSATYVEPTKNEGFSNQDYFAALRWNSDWKFYTQNTTPELAVDLLQRAGYTSIRTSQGIVNLMNVDAKKSEKQLSAFVSAVKEQNDEVLSVGTKLNFNDTLEL